MTIAIDYMTPDASWSHSLDHITFVTPTENVHEIDSSEIPSSDLFLFHNRISVLHAYFDMLDRLNFGGKISLSVTRTYAELSGTAQIFSNQDFQDIISLAENIDAQASLLSQRTCHNFTLCIGTLHTWTITESTVH